jgi:NADPH-dependent 2,4-dienoyl-CoA reductase/sulfur reductase-like enzyme
VSVQPATRAPNRLGRTLGTTRHWRRRLLFHHVPVALASAFVFALFMGFSPFTGGGYTEFDMDADGVFPQPREGRPMGMGDAGGQLAGPGLSFELPDRISISQLTDATGYVATVLLGLTLLVGPANLLLRRHNPISTYLRRDLGTWTGGFDGTVTLVGAEPHPPYDRPPLSKQFLTATAAPKFFRSEASLRGDLDVDLRLATPATALHTDERMIVAGDEEIGYTGLVIATGAKARELPGMPRLAGVHTLRSIDDALAIRDALQPGTRIVIIGAGFIGAEVACSARQRGAEVTVVEAASVPLVRAVGEAMGVTLANLLQRTGIDLCCDVAVEALEGNVSVEAVRLVDGSRLTADVVVVGVGAAPATGWLEGSGLELDDGVVCDETLNAGPPGVYAAGDVARWRHPLFGQTVRLEHWTTAAEHGALAARNAINPVAAAPCATVPFFWSDWGNDRIQFVGVPGADEIRVVDGDPGDGDFLALYRCGGHVTAALGLNQPRPVMRLRALIVQRASWPEALKFAQAATCRS